MDTPATSIGRIAIAMSRRRATVDQASIARAIRAAKANGAPVVEVQLPDGAIIRILVNAPEQPDLSANRDIIL